MKDFYDRVAEVKREVAKRPLLEHDLVLLASTIDCWEQEAVAVQDATAEWQRTAHFPLQQKYGEDAERLLAALESRLVNIIGEKPTVEMPIPPPPPRRA